MITDYFLYERELWQVSVLPVLRKAGIDLSGLDVLDVGCGHGGMLDGLSRDFKVHRAVGIDLDPNMIQKAQAKNISGTEWICSDFFAFDEGLFDGIFIRDALEHMPNMEDALFRAWKLLKPGGFLFLTYAPFYSPFGGHQHNGSGLFSNIPWLQLLPRSLFLNLIRCRDNAYKKRPSLEADIQSVLATRLTIRRLHKTLRKLGAHILLSEKYLVRPDYKIKFNLSSLRIPSSYIPVFSELFCTGEQILVTKTPAAQTEVRTLAYAEK